MDRRYSIYKHFCPEKWICVYTLRKTKSCFKFSKDNETLLPFQIYSLYDTSMQNAIVNKILLMSDTVGIAIHS